MKDYTRVVCLIICLSNLSFSQSDLENHKKYWYYKSRLNNDFLKIGATITNSFAATFQPSVANNMGPFRNDPNHIYNSLEGHGESLPFCERGFQLTSLNPNPTSILRTGDVPTNLGLYLAVLATEYRLLKNNTQPNVNSINRVKHEIFCALNAINRLDFFAEPFIHPGSSPALNGFLCRDDIPADFVSLNYKHFNFFSGQNNPAGPDDPTAKGFQQKPPFVGMVVVNSDFQNNDRTPASQDHMYYLLMGLTLTNKLVDPGETDNNQVFQYDPGNISVLPNEAFEISKRLLNYMKTAPLWSMRDPITNAEIINNSNNHIGRAHAYAYALDNLGQFIENGVDLPFFFLPGGSNSPSSFVPRTVNSNFRNSWSMSNPAFLEYQTISDDNGGPLDDGQGFFNILAGCGNNCYQNMLVVDILIESEINALNDLLAFLKNTSAVNLQQIIANLPSSTPQFVRDILNDLGSVTASLVPTILVIAYVSKLVKQLINVAIPSAKINVSDLRLRDNSLTNPVDFRTHCAGSNIHMGSEMYFGIYLRKILHGNSFTLPSQFQFLSGSIPSFVTNPASNFVQSTVRTILDDAPCNGNFNWGLATVAGYPNSGSVPSGHWGVENFLDRPNGLWTKSNSNCSSGSRMGELNGLDYLLLHNLFYLSEGTSVSMEDKSDRVITKNLPDGTLFTASNSSTIGAFEFITLQNTVASNASVTFRAGKEIRMLPGFGGVASGASAQFTIEPYDCAGVNPFSEMNRSAYPDSSGGQLDPLSFEDGAPQLPFTIAQSNTQPNLSTPLKYGTEIVPKKVFSPEPEAIHLKVVPNPSGGTIWINGSILNPVYCALKITDALGNRLYEQEFDKTKNSQPIDLSWLPKGLYIVEIICGEVQIQTQKIVIY